MSKKDDAKRLAKPAGYRFVGNNYAKPTKAEIEKGLKNGTVYYEDREKHADTNPKISVGHRKGIKSLDKGGSILPFLGGF